jgi:Na+-transporting NADH:ubiquinone oxidoreductase subunit C
MSSPVKSVLFAAIMCVTCSVLLTAASTGLQSFQQRNMAVDRHKNILKAAGIVRDDQRIDAEQVERLFQQRIKTLWVDADGRITPSAGEADGRLPFYALVEGDTLSAYIVPINTRGLWGEIHGYLAVENDGATIRGFTVYKHSETPGLGGEIESRWFRKNFKNKKIIDSKGNFVSIAVAKGTVADVVPEGRRKNYVDGISGATLTGKFLSAGLRKILSDYEPMAIEFRQKNPRYLRGHY